MKAPIGVSRSALRVADSRIVSAEPASCRTSRRLSGSLSAMCLVVPPGYRALPLCPPCPGGSSADGRESKRPFVSGTKGRTFRGATRLRHLCRSLGRRVGLSRSGGATPADRCCPVSLALCAGAYWRTLEVHGLVRRLTGPFAPSAAPACTTRWFSTPAPGVTRPDHSPCSNVAGVYGRRGGAVKRAPEPLRRVVALPAGRCPHFCHPARCRHRRREARRAADPRRPRPGILPDVARGRHVADQRTLTDGSDTLRAPNGFPRGKAFAPRVACVDV